MSLVPVGGGSGAFGKGQMVMKARNAGEAKWAKKLGSSHLDQRKKEAPRQLVSMRGGNNQKHYRDMLREYYGRRVAPGRCRWTDTMAPLTWFFFETVQ